MESSASNTRPSIVERVQLPPIQNLLVDTLPPPNGYRSPSSQSGWNPPFHHSGTDASNNGPQRNSRPQNLPPAQHTPPPHHRRVESPQTVTASPSVIVSSASSGVSEASISDYIRPPHSSAPQTLSTASAPIRTTPQDPNSPISSGLAPFPEAYRTIRPSHSLVSQIPSMKQHQQPRHPHGANQDSRLPAHFSGGRPTAAPTSTATAIGTRMNALPVINRDLGVTHRQSDQDSRRVPHPSDRQSGQPLRTFSPPRSTYNQQEHHFITPSSERFLPPRNGSEYVHRQHESRREETARDDQNRSRSHSKVDQYPPPTPPWDSQSLAGTYRSSSVRELDPGDARSRPGQYPLHNHSSTESPTSAVPSVAYRSHRSREQSGYTSRESRIRDDHLERPTSQGYSLRPARWVESGALYGPDKMDPPRQSDYHRQPSPSSRVVPEDEEHGILATRSDRRYPPILPAPSHPQRQFTGADELRGRHGSITVRNSRYGVDAALGMTREAVHPFAQKQTGATVHAAPFTSHHGPKPPLPSGLIRRKSKEDLGRVLHELTNEAARAVAEGKAMKKIHEFSRAVQQFAAYNARYPGPPAPSAEDMEEMSHRAVLIYRMAQAIKAKILAKKATYTQPPNAPTMFQPHAHARAQKKKPATKEEKQVQEDMERIRRKRTSAQQGVKSKYKKRNKQTIAPKQCASCNTKETPEWRKGPDGPRSLCNACGLHWAKLQRKRKEDGQWVGQGAPPPIDIITLRQVTGVGLQPRFNERGELEIPGTYSNIPPNRAVLSSFHLRKSPPQTKVPTSNEVGSSSIAPQSQDPIPAPLQAPEDNDIAIERLSMEDQVSQSPPRPHSQSPASPLLPDAPDGRAKKRKASRDHGASNTDEEERAAPSLKRRRPTSPQFPDNGQSSTSAQEPIWKRAS